MAIDGIVYVDAVAKSGSNPASEILYHQIQPRVWRMSRLTQDGAAGLFSRDQILRRERGQGNIHFLCLADQEQYWQPYRLMPSLLCVMAIHTYIHT